MDKIAIIIAGAILVEALVQIVKTWIPNVDTGKMPLAWWEILAALVGVGMAFVMKINIVDLVMETAGVAWYAGMIASGVIIGRGASFVYDLVGKLKG